MSKKTITREIEACDFCASEEGYAQPCLECGKAACWECQKTHGTVYTHAVSFSGSGDGFYCADCNARLTAEGTNKKHAAYRAISALRLESKAFHDDFHRRSLLAEKALRGLR